MKKHIIFGLILINTISIQAQNLTKSDIKEYATKMLISNDYSIKVIKILKPINDFQIALVDLPYREFPNILIFKYDSSSNKWSRIFECLCPGIQDKPSRLLDWHTVGLGIDFMTGNDTLYNLDNDRVKKMIDAMNHNNSIMIPYQHFLHMHTSDSISTKDFEPYTIDKTNYYDFALELFDKLYTGYPNQECTMFDSPKTIDIEFDYIENTYRITAMTDNGQIWNYSFNNVDDNNKYLTDKKIKVSKAR